MKKQLIKIFLTILILLTGIGSECYTIDFINVHNDLISLVSALASVAIILAMILCIYSIWFKQAEEKQINN